MRTTSSPFMRLTLAAAVAALSACNLTGPTGGGATPKPTRSTTSARKTPGPGGDASPTPTPPRPTAALPAGGKLLPPAGGGLALKGAIALDARYAEGVRSGSFISDQGAGVLRLADGKLISDAGGNLAGGDPAGIVSHEGAGFISDQGAGLISDRGGAIIANHGGGFQGGSFISDQGAGIVANNGGGMVGKTKFGLLEAMTGTPHVAAAAAGMLMGVLSLEQNAWLPLGVDAAGNPVYAIYTDAEGGFEVHLPAGTKAGNLLVTASAPGVTDPRMAVDLVVDPTKLGGRAARVDDGSTVITAYMRRAIGARMREALDPDPCLPPLTGNTQLGIALGLLRQLYEPALGADFKALPPAARRRVLARLADRLIATLDLAAIQTNPALAAGSTASGPALTVLEAVLAKVEARAAERLNADGAAFDRKPYVALANLARGQREAYAIRKPSDLSELLVDRYMLQTGRGALEALDDVLLDLDLPTSLRLDIQAAGGAAFAALIEPLMIGGEANLALLRDAVAAEKATATPAPEPVCPATPAPPDVGAAVSTLAGTGAKGGADGPGAAATFDRPTRLLAEPAGTLLVADAYRVRRIDPNDLDHPVTTLAGAAGEGYADGPLATARFQEVAGMAWKPGAPGTLWLADRQNHCIRQIAGLDGASPVVSTVAGLRRPGGGDAIAAVDGPAASAVFNFPWDLAFGPDGAAYVAEGGHRIRKISADGQTVSTFAGDGSDDAGRAGVGGDARVKEPRAIVRLRDGNLAVAEGGNNLLRFLTLPGAGYGTLAGTGFRPDKAHPETAAMTEAEAADGTWETTAFHRLVGIAEAEDGTLFVADSRNARIRMLATTGQVVTIAGGGAPGPKPEYAGAFADGPGASARFSVPEGLALVGKDTLYVADGANRRVRVIKLTLP